MKATFLNCTLKPSDHKHDWSKSTGEAAASNLVAVARSLAERPIPPPSG